MKTFWGNGGEWLASNTGRFTPGVRDPVHTSWKAGWDTEPVWTRWRKEKSHNYPARNLTPGRPAHNLVSVLTVSV